MQFSNGSYFHTFIFNKVDFCIMPWILLFVYDYDAALTNRKKICSVALFMKWLIPFWKGWRAAFIICIIAKPLNRCCSANWCVWHHSVINCSYKNWTFSSCRVNSTWKLWSKSNNQHATVDETFLLLVAAFIEKIYTKNGYLIAVTSCSPHKTFHSRKKQFPKSAYFAS